MNSDKFPEPPYDWDHEDDFPLGGLTETQRRDIGLLFDVTRTDNAELLAAVDQTAQRIKEKLAEKDIDTDDPLVWYLLNKGINQFVVVYEDKALEIQEKPYSTREEWQAQNYAMRVLLALAPVEVRQELWFRERGQD